MELQSTISQLRSVFGGFNAPASDEALAEFRASVGSVPDDLLALYRDHDGSRDLPESNGTRLAARLMPIVEVIEIQHAMQGIDFPKAGNVLWLWTDDNSNYCGIYTDGLLAGWLCVLDHEEPMLTPAFRSTASFLSQLLREATRQDGKHYTGDIPSLPRETPQTIADPATLEKDRQLSSLFLKQYRGSGGDDLRRLFAFCSICLTPIEDTEKVTLFFADPDIWIPEAAVRLLELRRRRAAVDELETLAREGKPNGDSAAMRLLVRMNTNESRRAITRLKQTLEGSKLHTLEMWSRLRGSLQPPRW